MNVRYTRRAIPERDDRAQAPEDGTARSPRRAQQGSPAGGGTAGAGRRSSALHAAIGRALGRKNSSLDVRVEEDGAISSGTAGILVRERGRLPVIIEAEFAPGRGVERAACRRVGVRTRHGDAVRTCISVVVPGGAADQGPDGMRRRLCRENGMRYAVFSLDRHGRHAARALHPAPHGAGGEGVLRYPDRDGWLAGSLADVMLALQAVSVSASDAEACASRLHRSSAAIGERIATLDAGRRDKMASLLRQPPSPQTWQMAALALLNAIAFYDEAASMRPGADLRSIDELRGGGGGAITVGALRGAWQEAADAGHGPIFSTALGLLGQIDAGAARQVIDELVDAVDYAKSRNCSRMSGLCGGVLQRTVGDRERLAAYYTRPESAEMMASIVLPPAGDPLWGDERSLLSMRVADLACGTGMLLATMYRQIVARHEAGGGRGSDVHEKFAGGCISGLDVLPLAAHMTVSSLAGVYPNVIIRDTNIHHMPIGRWGPGRSEYRLGSLDLIDDSDSTLFESSQQVTGSGEEGRTHHGIMDGSLDLIVMNPPFTKAGKRKRGDGGGWDAVAPFAAFGASDEEQEAMGRLARKKFAGTCAHGHAGLGSYFVAVCDKKLRPGGTMALILPSTIASGESWSRVRALLREKYDTTVMSMANDGMVRRGGAFSSDTGMLEVMLVARKRRSGDVPASPVFFTLRDRPLTAVEGAHMGEAIRRLEGIKAIEEGRGATPLAVGGHVAGHAATMDVEDAWPLVNVREPALLSAAYALRGHKQAMFTTLGRMCEFGPDSQLLIGAAQKGPFAVRDLDRGGGLPEYHALWNNDHEEQRTMMLAPDKAMDVKKGASDARVRDMWATASHVHVNLDPNYTSQSLLASFVDARTAGGRAWPALLIDDARIGKAFVMWHNSTLGILSYWMVAGRQQLGRGMTKRSGAARIHVPNFAAGGMAERTSRLAAAFDRLYDAELSPISDLEGDAARHRIDGAVASSLGMNIAGGEGNGGNGHGLVTAGKGGIVSVRLDALRRAMSLEPSIRGARTGHIHRRPRRSQCTSSCSP